jgi:hypothetical protein
MDPSHLSLFIGSCVQWVCVVVQARLLPVVESWLEIGLWPEIESWWEIASTSFVEYPTQA